MRHSVVFNYMLCTGGFIVALALLCGGGIWSLLGLLWCALLYVSGDLFRGVWRSYWRTNIRILKYFNCM